MARCCDVVCSVETLGVLSKLTLGVPLKFHWAFPSASLRVGLSRYKNGAVQKERTVPYFF